MKSKLLISTIILTLFCSLFLTNFSLAAEDNTYPAIPSIYGSTDSDYLIAKKISKDQIWLFLFYSNNGDVDISYKVENDQLVAYNNTSSVVYFRSYWLTGGKWENSESLSISANNSRVIFSNASTTYEYLESDFTIYNSDGTIFFQQPPMGGLLETTLAMIAEKIPAVGTEIVQKMRIILLCGVSCLVLLISLPLLLRAFSRFRH